MKELDILELRRESYLKFLNIFLSTFLFGCGLGCVSTSNPELYAWGLLLFSVLLVATHPYKKLVSSYKLRVKKMYGKQLQAEELAIYQLIEWRDAIPCLVAYLFVGAIAVGIVK